MFLPFNTSAFSNTLNAADRSAQCKALVAPFKEEFDGNSANVLHFIAVFTQRCQETGVVQDFTYVEHENSPPSTVDMNDSASRTAWLIDPRHFTLGNFLIDASQATLASVQRVRENIRDYLSTLTVSPDPIKQPIGAQFLVSYQNRQWIYVLLQTVWSSNMKLIMQRYQSFLSFPPTLCGPYD
jgi:hypothetical protein